MTSSTTTPVESNGAAARGAADPKERFRQLMRTSLISGARAGNPVLMKVAEHFGQDPGDLPTMTANLGFLINQQAALDAFLAESGRESEVLGVVVPTSYDTWSTGIADVLMPPSLPVPSPRFGQVGEERHEAGYKQWLNCWTRALILYRDADGPAAIWVKAWSVEVMAQTPERVSAVLDHIRHLSVEHSPFRGECVVIKVVKNNIRPHFVERPSHLTAADVILPPGLLDRIEEHVVEISRNREVLLGAKRHLRRGLLLWGRPGTGKTHTIRYLASMLPNHTVLTLPGTHLEALGHSGMLDMFKYCVPGIVVLDDVDFIAEDRTMPSMGQASSLYELLETLDGMNPDTDLLFVLTTNRADTIEPAVAARPGRVDQAMEIPPPDDECRRRLFALYGKGVEVDMDDAELDAVIKRTDGVTGSFFKELLRRASLTAAKAQRRNGNRLVVVNDDIVSALDEMLDPNSPLTQKMLGAAGTEHAPLGVEDDDDPDSISLPEEAF